MLKNKAFFFLLFFSTISLNSQTTDPEKALYKWFDITVGYENSGLLDGIAYREQYKTNNGDHQFYKSSSFLKGNVTYNRQSYFDVDLKYDIHNDEVIAKIPTQSTPLTIQLIKENINNFSIGNSEFKLLHDGFYEIISITKTLSLFKKHKKTSTKHYSGRLTFYRFNESKNEYYLYFNNNYHRVSKSKIKLIKALPDFKNEINSFYKSQNDLLKTNHDLFMKKLIVYLNDKISKQGA